MESDTGVEGEEENPQLEEEDGVGESSQYWLQLEKVTLRCLGSSLFTSTCWVLTVE